MSRSSNIPPVFDWERSAFPKLKKVWHYICSSKLFKIFRRSHFNPYHRHLLDIERETVEDSTKNDRKKKKTLVASSFEEAFKIAREKKQAQFVFDGVRYYAERDCSVNQEYLEEGVVLRGRGDVADRIPKDKDGNLDLLAEDPIVISIIPMEGPALIGHVAMQYKDRVVNRLIPSIHTDPLFPKYKDYSEYYFVYPSALGVSPKKLLREMDKHNIKYGDKKYNVFTNNCAKNVAMILKKIGVNDLDFYGPDKLGVVFTSPGNNPFNVGIKAWCFKHGVHVHAEEVALLDERFPINDVKKRREEMKEKRIRYRQYIKQSSTDRKTVVKNKERDR